MNDLIIPTKFEEAFPTTIEGLKKAWSIFDSIKNFDDIEREFLLGQGLSPNTYKNYLGAVKQFYEFTEGMHPLQVKPADIERYYDNLIQFIQEKDKLISGKYKRICSQELTAFYDKRTRDNLEKILAEKIEQKNREFFAIGPLEQELKKIGQIAGAKSISIITPRESDKYLLKTVKSVIEYSHGIDEAEAERVGREIKNFLESKKFKALIHAGFILTDAKLLLDNG